MTQQNSNPQGGKGEKGKGVDANVYQASAPGAQYTSSFPSATPTPPIVGFRDRVTGGSQLVAIAGKDNNFSTNNPGQTFVSPYVNGQGPLVGGNNNVYSGIHQRPAAQQADPQFMSGFESGNQDHATGQSGGSYGLMYASHGVIGSGQQGGPYGRMYATQTMQPSQPMATPMPKVMPMPAQPMQPSQQYHPNQSMGSTGMTGYFQGASLVETPDPPSNKVTSIRTPDGMVWASGKSEWAIWRYWMKIRKITEDEVADILSIYPTLRTRFRKSSIKAEVTKEVTKAVLKARKDFVDAKLDSFTAEERAEHFLTLIKNYPELKSLLQEDPSANSGEELAKPSTGQEEEKQD